MGCLRVRVDLGLCQGHGLCQEEAPEVFRVVDRPGDYAQVEVILERPPEELREKVLAAVRFCPNRVISVEDDGAAGSGGELPAPDGPLRGE